MSTKVRSTFWVVSTHVLTTGLAIPALAALASTGIILVGRVRNSWVALGVLTSCALVGYIGGTYYSLRLLGGCVGLAIGFAVGLGIAIYFDRGGWQPQNGWQMRFVTALVVGGIGLVVGIISGPPRR